jgi:quercetin dioxygenase-like cupin family protein
MSSETEVESFYDVGRVDEARRASGRSYLEFLRTGQLSAGLYVLARGATDSQSPHSEDEVSIVLSGRGLVTVGDETRPVSAGSIVRAAPGVVHRFHDVDEELQLFVFFAPPQGAAS